MESRATIEVNGLSKTFRTYRKQPGISGAPDGLFQAKHETTVATNGVNFRVPQASS